MGRGAIVPTDMPTVKELLALMLDMFFSVNFGVAFGNHISWELLTACAGRIACPTATSHRQVARPLADVGCRVFRAGNPSDMLASRK